MYIFIYTYRHRYIEGKKYMCIDRQIINILIYCISIHTYIHVGGSPKICRGVSPSIGKYTVHGH